MLTLPNFLSLLRIPLALLFIQGNPLYRVIAIILAMISDVLDGYLARKFGQTSRIGTLIDPITDKFFVFIALSILISEHRLALNEAAAMLCRDFSVIFFGIYLALTGHLTNYKFRAIYCGKITTSLQFIVLLALTLNYEIPSYTYGVFIFLGFLALGELFLFKQRMKTEC